MSDVPGPIQESADTQDAIERAREFGIDISLLQSNLRLTPGERILRVQSAVNSLRALHAAIAAGRAQPGNTSEPD